MGRFYGFWVFFIDRRPLLVRSGYFSWLGEGLSWTPDAFSGRDVRLVPGGLYWKRERLVIYEHDVVYDHDVVYERNRSTNGAGSSRLPGGLDG